MNRYLLSYVIKTLLFAGVATVTTLLTTLPALAENWVLVSRRQSGVDDYIDTESVQGNNGTYLFWWMSVSPKPDENGIVATKTYLSMSCPLQGFRIKAIASFNRYGELVTRSDLGETEPLQFFTSGSVGEGLWKFVCQ